MNDFMQNQITEGSYTTDINNCRVNIYDWWWDNYYPHHYCYPVYPIPFPSGSSVNIVTNEDKGKKAIKILKMLTETKSIELKTIKEFIDILDKIIEIL